jgi:hypothetical protein
MPMRVPIFVLSVVKAAKSTGGRAMKMPEQNPNLKVMGKRVS